MSDERFMRQALRLARRGLGTTHPNPMVGAVLVRRGKVIGQGWHQFAGGPHAEVNAIQDAERRGHATVGSTLYVTLEPCSTHGRTPPCTDAIVRAGISRLVVGATDPNPLHSGRAFKLLQRIGIKIDRVLEQDCANLNEPFNHWIVDRTPFVTVKAAMSLDGKIATARGESKWITGPEARAAGMRLRAATDAILVGINTVLADNPSLTVRATGLESRLQPEKPWRRIILDSLARTPLKSRVVADSHADCTTIVVSQEAPRRRVSALAKKVRVMIAPPGRHDSADPASGISIRWLLKELGAQGVVHLLVEGGGEANASFLLGGFAHRIAFFYAPKIIGGRNARRAVAGIEVPAVEQALRLRDMRWSRLGPDLFLSARIASDCA